MNVIIPGNTTIFEVERTTLWFDVDGILNALVRGIEKGVAHIFGKGEAVQQIAHNKKVCLLIYSNEPFNIDKKEDKFSDSRLPDIYKAVAFVAKSPLRKKIMSVFFKMKSPAIPIKIFTNDSEAKQWLKKFL